MMKIYELCSVKRGLNAFASIDPFKPVQADMGHFFFFIFELSACSWIILPNDSVICFTKWIFMDP